MFLSHMAVSYFNITEVNLTKATPTEVNWLCYRLCVRITVWNKKNINPGYEKKVENDTFQIGSDKCSPVFVFGQLLF